MKCIHCEKELNQSDFRSQRTLKSCPKCSQHNGNYHVYHPYPDDFGTTQFRASSNNPDGPQSYCESCRGGNAPRTGIECHEII